MFNWCVFCLFWSGLKPISIWKDVSMMRFPQKVVSASVFLSCIVATPAIAVADLSYLQGLLAATPEGGWVQVNVNKFSSAWPSQADGVPNSNPAAVVHAWSSFAWDSSRGNLLLFGVQIKEIVIKSCIIMKRSLKRNNFL